MDSLITAAARALSMGDPLGALKCVALRDDPPALALRGIAMAQLGDFDRARTLLRNAARSFGPHESRARARCVVAEAEIALVSRDLSGTAKMLDEARAVLTSREDRVNAAHAGYLQARRLLLIGRLDAAERVLDDLDPTVLPPALRASHALVVSGIAMRRRRSRSAREALDRAEEAAQEAGIGALMAEIEAARRQLSSPAARLCVRGETSLVGLDQVEELMESGRLVVDASRHELCAPGRRISLARRPVLFALLRALADAWPGDASRTALVTIAFGAKEADESHRARLRVEAGRLRALLRGLAEVRATPDGFLLAPTNGREIAVLAPPVEDEHASVRALLADGEAWSSSALALALAASQRTVQRSLEALSCEGKARAIGRGRALRWVATGAPDFPTLMLLPASSPEG